MCAANRKLPHEKVVRSADLTGINLGLRNGVRSLHHPSYPSPLVIVPISSDQWFILYSEEALVEWDGGLDAFARSSSQRVAMGRAEILSCEGLRRP